MLGYSKTQTLQVRLERGSSLGLPWGDHGLHGPWLTEWHGSRAACWDLQAQVMLDASTHPGRVMSHLVTKE